MHYAAVIAPVVRKCPVCGLYYARSCTPRAWGYAYDNQLVCSYGCMRKAEQLDREGRWTVKVKGTKKELNEQTAAIARMYREGADVKEIATKVGRSDQAVYNALKRAGVQLRIGKRNTKEEDAKMEERNDEPRIEVVQPDSAAEDMRSEIRRLEKRLAEEKALADAAMNLMIIWKERYDLAERTRTINGELNAKEAAYFEALRAARPMKEANG